MEHNSANICPKSRQYLSPIYFSPFIANLVVAEKAKSKVWKYVDKLSVWLFDKIAFQFFPSFNRPIVFTLKNRMLVFMDGGVNKLVLTSLSINRPYHSFIVIQCLTYIIFRRVSLRSLLNSWYDGDCIH